jgi:predicted ATPase
MEAWETVEVLHRGTRSLLTRVRRSPDGASFVLKQSLAPAPRDAVEREEQVLSVVLGCEGVIRSFGLASWRGEPALVLESFEGESLERRLLRGRLLPTNALGLALSVLSALGKLHARGIVHGDLRPENVLIASDGSSRLIDFGSALPIGSELAQAARLDGTLRALAYAAPEQLALAPQRIDRRTDYYRFGALLYELLTGRPPFADTELDELMASHAVRMPRAPRELVPELSPALERVLLKLLEKDPHARYQSEARLRDALACCREAARQKDLGFDGLSTEAEAPTFALSTRLFGRDAALVRLERVLDGALHGRPALVALEGPSGIGKTALGKELGRRVTARGGLVLHAELTPHDAADPGAWLERVLGALGDQLGLLPSGQLRALYEALEQRCPGAAGVLVGASAALAVALPGAVPAEPRDGALDPAARGLGELLALLAEQGLSTCLFIDELGFVPGSAWRALRSLLAAAERTGIALVTATTSDDEDALARARSLVAELTAQGYTLAGEQLGPVTRTDLRKLLGASLSQRGPDLDTLEELLWKWSQGSPLLARTLLEAMAQRCVAFDQHGRPFVELGRARSLLAESSLEALLGQRFRALPADTRYALGLAACLGHSFELGVLAAAIGGDIHACLAPATAAGLVVSEPSRPGTGPSHARFVHERVRLIACEGVTADELAARHLALARVFVQRLELAHDRRALPSALLAALLAAVEHLHHARGLLGPDELAEQATLELRAVREATRAGYGDLALRVAQRAVAALPEAAWETGGARVRGVLLAQADAALAWGDVPTATATLDALRPYAVEPRELADVLTLEGRIHDAELCAGKAREAYLQALSVLRAPLAERPSERDVRAERERTSAALKAVPDAGVLALGEAREERVRHELALLGRLVLAAAPAEHALMAVAAGRIVRHALRHGHAPESALGFAHHAALCAAEGELEQATRYGRLALELAQRFGSAQVLAHVQWLVVVRVLSRTQSYRRLVPQLVGAQKAARAAGDAPTLCRAAVAASVAALWAGEPLPMLADSLAEQRTLARGLGDPATAHVLDGLSALVHTLRTPGAAAVPLEHERIAQLRATGQGSALSHDAAFRALAAIVARAPSAALAALAEDPGAHHDAGVWVVPSLVLDAVARLLALPALPHAQRSQERQQVAATLTRLEAARALAPDEVEHRLRLVQALEAASAAQPKRASQLFAEAVELASRAAPAWEALAAEQAARHALAQGERGEASVLLLRAAKAYGAWGAGPKADALSRELSELSSPAATPGPELLDAGALRQVLAAARTIAGPLAEGDGLARILSALLAISGAERGQLLTPRGDSFQVEVCQGELEADRALLARVAEAGGDELSADALYVAFADGANTLLIVCLAQPAHGFAPSARAMLRELAPHVLSALSNTRLVAGLERALGERARTTPPSARSEQG